VASGIESFFAIPLYLSPLPVSLDTADVAARTLLGQESEAITEKNWRQHPKIVAIRRIVSAVDAGLKQGSFKNSQRKFECGGGPLLRRIAAMRKASSRGIKIYGYAKAETRPETITITTTTLGI